MKLRILGIFCVLAALSLGQLARADDAPAGPIKTEIKKTADGKWQLLRDGKPYFIKGGGGDFSKQVLLDCGGNSFRTWGTGGETQGQLDEAQKLGVTVTLGIWLGHKDDGFDYKDAAAVKKQFDSAKAQVEKFKNSPALLLWSVGNEEENGNDIPEVWNHIEDLAKMIHQEDPNHPVMSVVAEIGGDKVAHINQYCPDLDIVGINSYGGGPSVGDRYVKGGGTKPYAITEFGPPGTWEIPMNPFGAAPELTSTAKADKYRETYEKSILGQPGLCIGSYAFAWGYKIEATSTWYGMFLPDKSKLAAVDTVQELWSGKPPENPCPVMAKLEMESPDQVKAGDTIKAAVDVSDPKGGPLTIDWQLYREQATYNVQGAGAAATAGYPDAIAKNGEKEVTIKVPAAGGIYRIYCYVHNSTGGAAVGSLPVKVKGIKVAFHAPAVTSFPFVVYSGDQTADAPYAASGIMAGDGDLPSLSVDPASTDNPRPGMKKCLKVAYASDKGWAGCLWQSPANDWKGTKPGGFDLTQADKLTFWARGAAGGEKVTFGMGGIGIENHFHDSAKAELKDMTLTKDWKQYSIPLADFDLSCIKTGFKWVFGTKGAPITFYLDDIKYEVEPDPDAKPAAQADTQPATAPATQAAK